MYSALELLVHSSRLVLFICLFVCLFVCCSHVFSKEGEAKLLKESEESPSLLEHIQVTLAVVFPFSCCV